MKDISILGIDTAKLVFHVVGMNKSGKVILKKRLHRVDLESFVMNLPKVLIGMEACSGSNYWYRQFIKYGHDVKLIAPQFVKPYVKSNKNDMNDAEAIAEAVSRPNMRFVSPRSIDQQDIQMLHRSRERVVKNRTAIVNEIRGFLGEYGIIIPKGKSKFKENFLEIIEKESLKLSDFSKENFYELYREFLMLEERVDHYDKKLIAISKAHPECQRLETIPGIGPISSTALIASIGNISNFRNAREFSAFIGLVPRQHSTGGKSKLMGISKRGDIYLRKLLIHGARSALLQINKSFDRKSEWLKQLKDRRGYNRTAVALANKNARIIWALLTRGGEYQKFVVS